MELSIKELHELHKRFSTTVQPLFPLPATGWTSTENSVFIDSFDSLANCVQRLPKRDATVVWTLFFNDTFKFDRLVNSCFDDMLNGQRADYSAFNNQSSPSVLGCLAMSERLGSDAFNSLLRCIEVILCQDRLRNWVRSGNRGASSTKIHRTVEKALKVLAITILRSSEESGERCALVLPVVTRFLDVLPKYNEDAVDGTLDGVFEACAGFCKVLTSISISMCVESAAVSHRSSTTSFSPECSLLLDVVSKLPKICRVPMKKSLQSRVQIHSLGPAIDQMRIQTRFNTLIVGEASLMIILFLAMAPLSRCSPPNVALYTSLVEGMVKAYAATYAKSWQETVESLHFIMQIDNDTLKEFVVVVCETISRQDGEGAMTEHFVRILVSLLGDKNHIIRSSSASALRPAVSLKCDALQVSTQLELRLSLNRLCEDKVGSVRCAAVGSLADLSRSDAAAFDAQVIHRFLDLCEDSKLAVRVEAFWAVAKYLVAKLIPHWFINEANNESMFVAFHDIILRLVSRISHAVVNDSEKTFAPVLRAAAGVSFLFTHPSGRRVPTDLATSVNALRSSIQLRIQKLFSDLSALLGSKNQEVVNAYCFLLLIDSFVLTTNFSEDLRGTTTFDAISSMLRHNSVLLQLQTLQGLLLLFFCGKRLLGGAELWDSTGGLTRLLEDVLVVSASAFKPTDVEARSSIEKVELRQIAMQRLCVVLLSQMITLTLNEISSLSRDSVQTISEVLDFHKKQLLDSLDSIKVRSEPWQWKSLFAGSVAFDGLFDTQLLSSIMANPSDQLIALSGNQACAQLLSTALCDFLAGTRPQTTSRLAAAIPSSPANLRTLWSDDIFAEPPAFSSFDGLRTSDSLPLLLHRAADAGSEQSDDPDEI